MGTYRLICHPDTPSRSPISVQVESEANEGLLWLRYVVECELDRLALPDPMPAGIADGLWTTTCFEAFVAANNESSYAEYNFSPSSQWAAYSFEKYRSGMGILTMASPEIGLDASQTHFALEATIRPPVGSAKLALSAVIEETDGTKSFWALAHPPGKPDFHHPTCFAAMLAAPEAP